MRWKPSGRAGIEDRRDQDGGAYMKDVERRIAEHERINYYRRTDGLPELPLPIELQPAVRPGDGWGATTPAPAPARERPASEGWSVPYGTNPIVDMALSPEVLGAWRSKLASRLSKPHFYAHPGMDKTYQDLNKFHDAPIREDIAAADRAKGMVKKIADLRKIRRDAGEK